METVTHTVNRGDVYPKNSSSCNNDVLVTLIDKKAYIPLASCLVEYIISHPDLNESEKIFYLLVEMHAHLDGAKYNERCAIFSGKIWGQKLNLSEEWIFTVQKSLERKGFLKIVREKDTNNQNFVNKIFPTLPKASFEYLCEKYPTRDNCSITTEPQDVAEDDFNSHINKTKLFIKFNLKQIELLVRNSSLTNLQKLTWLYCYMCSYKRYVDHSVGEWSFPITSKELAVALRCAPSSSTRILTKLEEQGFIKKTLRRKKPDQARATPRRKVVWYLEALVPKHQASILLNQPDRKNLQPTEYYEKIFYRSVDNSIANDPPDNNFVERSGAISESKAEIAQNPPIYNKEYNTKNKNTKNNDPEVVDKIESKKLDLEDLEQLDITEEKHQVNIKLLGSEKAAKATNYAKKLKKLGMYSSPHDEITENELIRQFVHHAAHFKMTKLGINSREAEIDAALNFAYKAAKEGRWKCPQGWGKAIDLHLEKQKYMYLDPADEQLKKFKYRIEKYLNFSKSE